MQIFGLSITKAQPPLSPPDSRGSWWPIVREPFSGAWQRNEELSADNCLAFFAPFACHTLICGDVAKNRIRLVALKDKVWQETTNPAYSPVLRKPNEYQNRIQFIENWVGSKLARGNAYILKRRDGRGVVTGLYVLNPDRVQPLVSADGQVFYRLSKDNLSGLDKDEGVVVPAREIIHDRFNCLFHPLVGISPLYAAALSSTQGTNIQQSMARLAANGVRPGGILTAPGKINPDDALRLKETWESQYGGSQGAAKIAILGDGLKFESLTMKAEDAQLIEQLKFTAEMICAAYHVPPFMIGVGTEPTAGGVQDRTLRYYTQCLQKHIEDIELCLDEGLGIGDGVIINGTTYGTEFDIDNLLRLDSATQMDVLEKSKGKMTVNEMRAKLGLGPVEGGDTVYLQEQDHSLEWLAKRDAEPIAAPPPPPPSPDPNAVDPAANDNPQAAKALAALVAYSVREKLNARR